MLDNRTLHHPNGSAPTQRRYFVGTSPLTGEHLADPLKCNTNRQIGPCGMDAQHWEAGDPPAVGFV